MRLFGLIGRHLSHSFSERFFFQKFSVENLADCQYKTFDLPTIEYFPKLLSNYNLAGLNVTIPYKTAIIPFLDACTDEAMEIGAVNVIRFENGKRIGYNSDAFGFRQSLQPLLQSHHTKALILGNGGASKAIQYALQQLGISYQIVSRHPINGMLSYAQLTDSIILDTPLLINTTPLGTYPKIEDKPDIPYRLLNANHLLYDLVYNPTLTAFLKEGKRRGTKTENGYNMLVSQANKSWEIWNT